MVVAVQPYATNAALLGAGAVPSADGPTSAKYSAFNLKSYRKFFNVDTQACPASPPVQEPYLCSVLCEARMHASQAPDRTSGIAPAGAITGACCRLERCS